MNKASLAVLLLMCASFTAISILPERASANTLYVGGLGVGNYATIQEAVNDANPGDRIYVYAGVYRESIWIDKAVSLIGQDANETFIKYEWPGSYTGPLVYILADNVRLEGFSIVNEDEHGGGVEVYGAQNCHVLGNDISSNFIGIEVHFSDGTIIRKNTVSGAFTGISLKYSRHLSVLDNIVSESDWGILLWADANESTVSGNIVSNNEFGIQLRFASHNVVSNNHVSNNFDGIRLEYSDYNTIFSNMVSDNGDGILLIGSRGNRVYHNNLIENGNQASDDTGTNQWDNGYPSGGNFWSDYEGVDTRRGSDQDQSGSDGIGDTAYDILEGLTFDRYPLMDPYVDEKSIFEQAWFWAAIIIAAFVAGILLLLWKGRKTGLERPGIPRI